jgi:hypothetical protein
MELPDASFPRIRVLGRPSLDRAVENDWIEIPQHLGERIDVLDEVRSK